MKEKTFTLIIANVDTQVFRGEVSSVTLPTTHGHITVLAHHQPTIALLQEGVIKVTNDEEHVFDVEKGVAEISENHVTVLI